MLNRRRLLKQSMVVSLSPVLPTFLNSTVFAQNKQHKSDGRILVVIQLDGGNDGINTVVPYKDEGYAKHRKELRILENDLIKLTDEFAFHPRLRSASELFEDGRLSIVHGVGYPNPNRSHFESMGIWHTAAVETEKRLEGNGWLGQALSSKSGVVGPHAIQIGDEALAVALRGRRCDATSMSSFADLNLRMTDGANRKLSNEFTLSDHNAHVAKNALNDFVTKSVSDAYVSAEQLASMTNADLSAPYPNSQLGYRLRMISQMIKLGGTTQVYYTMQSGYDTHAEQLLTHGNLLGELSSSLKAFSDDLKQSGLHDQLLVMAFSEFGRRVSENDSLGTDHGTAGPIILCGNNLALRSYGKLPSLLVLENDDLKHTVDFRDLYSAVVTDWLQLPAPDSLKGFKLRGVFT